MDNKRRFPRKRFAGAVLRPRRPETVLVDVQIWPNMRPGNFLLESGMSMNTVVGKLAPNSTQVGNLKYHFSTSLCTWLLKPHFSFSPHV